MPTAHIDTLTTLEMTEVPRGDGNSMIIELRRMARIVDLPNAALDWQVLQEALDNLNLTLGTTPAGGHENLVLVHRRAIIIPGELDKVDVELIYESIGRTLDSVVSDGDPTTNGKFVMEGHTRLQQVQTQVDRFGNKLGVYHCFPDTYSGNPKWVGKLVYQVGEVSVAMPHTSITLVGRFKASHPDYLLQERVGFTNDDIWRGEAAGEWICAEGSFVPYYIDNQPPATSQDVWEFSYLLQHNPLGWNPDVWFRDPMDGRQPANIFRHVDNGNDPPPYIPPVPPAVVPGASELPSCDGNVPERWGEYEVFWYIQAAFDELFPL